MLSRKFGVPSCSKRFCAGEEACDGKQSVLAASMSVDDLVDDLKVIALQLAISARFNRRL
jgi:hypothetical protein